MNLVKLRGLFTDTLLGEFKGINPLREQLIRDVVECMPRGIMPRSPDATPGKDDPKVQAHYKRVRAAERAKEEAGLA